VYLKTPSSITNFALRRTQYAVSIYCLIPAKPHTEAKSRLNPLLTAAQRIELSRWLLRRTVDLAREVVGRVVVVSRDPAVLSEAEALGAWGLLEASPGLNPALTQAARFAQGRGAGGLLVLPTDLPRLTASDLEEILALAAPPPALVIAPCRHGTGTNALLLRPPGIIPFAFGPDSFAAHSAAARAAGIEPLVYRAETIALDLDTPEDWRLGIGKWGNRDWESELRD
jgi:2-phospho-L-lactate guanylyltransferase